MDAPYEVLTNLLRFRLGKGYSPNPYHMFLNEKEKKSTKKPPLPPGRKIEIIHRLSDEAGVAVAAIFDDFYDSKLRNAISHSDYILTDEEFRCRGGTGATRAFRMSLENLNDKITRAKAFISRFFGMEAAARRMWAEYKDKAMPYDAKFKGLMEVLVDNDGLMCGFKIHWPNNSESVYRRTKDGIDMINCNLSLRHATIEMFVNRYAREPGTFSPLVERDAVPAYTMLDNGETPVWPTTLTAIGGFR